MVDKSAPKGWKEMDGSLNRQFEFSDFKQAFEFMTKVAAEAEKLNHHPDWSNSYNNVSVTLTTHSTKGLTGKDYELAHAINRIAAGFSD